MKYIYLILLCSLHLSANAELSQLEDMERYSISMEGKELDSESLISSIKQAQTEGVDTLGVQAAVLNIIPPVDSQTVTVRDTGHSFVLQPIEIQIGKAGF